MSEYKSIVLEKFKGKLQIKTKKLPEKLEEDQILVKVMATTIMPADLALLQGTYGSFLPSPPFTPGMEGCGIIEKVGDSIDKNLIGKHCSVVSNSSSDDYSGIWSQYVISKRENLLIFQTSIQFDKICNAQSNPFTAIGFLQTLIKRYENGQQKSLSVAHTGASSAFGRMFMRLFLLKNVEVINIVRKESSIKEMGEMGGKHFINTSEKDFLSQK